MTAPIGFSLASPTRSVPRESPAKPAPPPPSLRLPPYLEFRPLHGTLSRRFEFELIAGSKLFARVRGRKGLFELLSPNGELEATARPLQSRSNWSEVRDSAGTVLGAIQFRGAPGQSHLLFDAQCHRVGRYAFDPLHHDTRYVLEVGGVGVQVLRARGFSDRNWILSTPGETGVDPRLVLLFVAINGTHRDEAYLDAW